MMASTELNLIICGRIEIDNNPAENAIRPNVISRKIGYSPSVQWASNTFNLYEIEDENMFNINNYLTPEVAAHRWGILPETVKNKTITFTSFRITEYLLF